MDTGSLRRTARACSGTYHLDPFCHTRAATSMLQSFHPYFVQVSFPGVNSVALTVLC